MRILGAIGFLSKIPVRVNIEPSKVVGDFPAVGYLSGGLYILIFYLAGRSWPVTILGILINYMIFNAFHFDGLLDTADAFLSQKNRSKKMEIMKMGNSGPMAILIGVLYMMIFAFVLEKSSFMTILAASVFGRYAMVFVAYISKPARNEGLGASIFPVKLSSLIRSSIYLIPFCFFPRIVLSLIIGLVCVVGMKFLSDRLIGGFTGDTLGATEEIGVIAVMAGRFFMG
ncbi:adenosylcobinamide-GDP ribazoletransferase [Athalassotoga saccharophila]|uniref:adenosylcobinamide-GDP ribazoletransferase n=1 Tax=Athalassotoga saccharophila TaxID=1441386 RepID=UPI001379F7A5|nr:adenosylcobinamide-GDP ribazoletransferase [Athalassotoga saccharophila]BBJ27991.1 cobalamin synthase [Athalassotoga saccharophila]